MWLLLASGQVIASGEAFTISGISGDWSPSGSIQANGKSAAGFVLEVKPDAITTGNTLQYPSTVNHIQRSTRRAIRLILFYPGFIPSSPPLIHQ